MNIKEFIEKQNEKKQAMRAIVEKCRAEKRPMTEEESATFDSLKAEVTELESTIAKIQEVDEMQLAGMPIVKDEKHLSTEEQDVKEFAAYLRQTFQRMPVQANITRGDNADIIPVTIANKIIDRVSDISPIFNSVTKYHVKGSLYIPYIAAGDDNITADYATEFVSGTPSAVSFSTVKLSNFLVSVNVLMSKSLIRNTDIALTDFVINKMAKAIAVFLEKETLIGTNTGATGLSTLANSQIITSNTVGAIDFDDIIELMAAVKSDYQRNAYFVMNASTLTALRKLKDGNDRYLLNNDVTSPFGFTLLGKPVYMSDQMPVITKNKIAIYYGDFGEALAANITEDFEIQVLLEKFADQHAVGITGWMEFDEKIANEQAVAALKVKNS